MQRLKRPLLQSVQSMLRQPLQQRVLSWTDLRSLPP